jgi:hypothetical protein
VDLYAELATSFCDGGVGEPVTADAGGAREGS